MTKGRTDTTSSWLDSTQAPSYARLETDLAVDVAVVGGGVTGITAAYLLKQAGHSVALVERRRVAWGESGRSSAHVSLVPDVPLARLIERLGAEQARAVWDAGFAATSRIRSIVRDERIKCQFAWVPGYLHAPRGLDSAPARELMRLEAAAADLLRIPVRCVESVPSVGTPGLVFDNQARLHPVKYLGVLAQRIHGDGSYVFEESEVSSIEDTPLTIRIGRFRLRADYLVLATHLPVVGDARATHDIVERTTFVVRAVSAPGATEEALYWEHADTAYEHLRIDRHEGFDEVLIGGGDLVRPTPAAVAHAFEALEARLAARVPGAAVTHRWSGSVIDSHDGLPLIGETGSHRFAATALGGNGFTYGTLAGMMAADAVAGRANPWRGLFDIRRASLGPAPSGTVPRSGAPSAHSERSTVCSSLPVAMSRQPA